MSRHAYRLRADDEKAEARDTRVPHPGPDLRALPASEALLALQSTAGNQAVVRMMAAGSPGRGTAAPDAAEAFALAASGPAGEVPRRREMEDAFGTSFAGVRAHAGGSKAAAGLDALGARAATSGAEIVFREADPGPGLVAHELAHVLQQRGGMSGVQTRRDGAVAAETAAEGAADLAAAAVARGEPVPAVGAVGPGQVQLAPVSTAGGVWDTATYAAVTAAGVVGANIDVNFTPRDPVLADGIGLTQSVKTLKSTAAGGAVNVPGPASPRKGSISLGAGESDPGRAIDQGDPGDADTIPNTNPLYAVENTPGAVSASLTDVPPTAAWGAHAHRKLKPDGTFDVAAGNLKDTPRRPIDFAGQQWRQTFEVTALALDGALANMYLGSVEWGWRSDASGTSSLDPDPIRVVREGPPTAAFMDAARKWNAATFTDPSTGTSYSTVDLPIEAVDPGALTTTDLAKRLQDANRDAAALPAGDPKTRKQFEALALERELTKRNVKIAVTVIKTEDFWGSDEVYVKLVGKLTHKTSVKDLNDGQSHDFLVPLSALSLTLPLTDPVEVEVYDEDWPDKDDLIVKMTWSAPYAPTKNTSSMDEANYDVTISYER